MFVWFGNLVNEDLALEASKETTIADVLLILYGLYGGVTNIESHFNTLELSIYYIEQLSVASIDCL